jgi:glycerol-3-phosphate cytidylyltransferase-like family protein
MRRGKVSVVVARDHNVARIKGKPSRQNEEERCRILRETFPGVDVVLGDANDFLAPVRRISPDLILLGYDQRLPPGVLESDLPCPIERLPAFRPELYKSSRMRSDAK